jgi:hypothetical protein
MARRRPQSTDDGYTYRTSGDPESVDWFIAKRATELLGSHPQTKRARRCATGLRRKGPSVDTGASHCGASTAAPTLQPRIRYPNPTAPRRFFIWSLFRYPICYPRRKFDRLKPECLNRSTQFFLMKSIWWGRKDSNLRSHEAADLQSAPFATRDTPPLNGIESLPAVAVADQAVDDAENLKACSKAPGRSRLWAKGHGKVNQCRQ